MMTEEEQIAHAEESHEQCYDELMTAYTVLSGKYDTRLILRTLLERAAMTAAQLRVVKIIDQKIVAMMFSSAMTAALTTEVDAPPVMCVDEKGVPIAGSGAKQ